LIGSHDPFSREEQVARDQHVVNLTAQTWPRWAKAQVVLIILIGPPNTSTKREEHQTSSTRDVISARRHRIAKSWNRKVTNERPAGSKAELESMSLTRNIRITSPQNSSGSHKILYSNRKHTTAASTITQHSAAIKFNV